MSNVAQNAKPKITEIEGFGIDTIPDADRTSTPWDLFRIQFGGANTFATVLLGTFPIAFGLSFWQGVASVVLGVLVGIGILYRQRSAHHGLLTSPYLPGREPKVEDAETAVEATDFDDQTSEPKAGSQETVALESDKPETN